MLGINTNRFAGRVAVTSVVVVALLGVGAYAGAQSGGSNSPTPGPEPRAGAASPTENGFVPITPCRIVNTQTGGRIGVGQTRAYRMHGNTSSQGGAADCGIPSSATALEVTVHAVLATGTGYLRVFPATGSEPNATFLNYGHGLNQSNTGTIAVTPGGGNSFRVKVYGSSVHVIVDVAGYYVPGLFAVVTAAGGLVRGNGVVQAVREGNGTYRVNFDRNISGCSWQGGLHDPGAFFGTPGEINLALNGGSPNGLFVQTRNPAGALADSEFMVSVTC